MSAAAAEPKRKAKRSKKPASQGNTARQAPRKISKAKPFNWKLAFGVFAILGLMTLLFSPNDPASFKDDSSAKSSGAFQGLAKR